MMHNSSPEQHGEEINHPLKRDGLTDLIGYLRNLDQNNTVRFETDTDEEIGELQVWTVEKQNNGVLVQFKNESNPMPVSEHNAMLADSCKQLFAWVSEEIESLGVANLQSHHPSESPTEINIGQVTAVDYETEPEKPSSGINQSDNLDTVHISLSSEWERHKESQHETVNE